MGSNTFQRKTLHLNICSCPHARLKSLFTKPLRFAKSAWKSLAPATLSAFGVSVPATQSLYERRVTVTVTPSVSRSAASRPGAGGAAASRAPRTAPFYVCLLRVGVLRSLAVLPTIRKESEKETQNMCMYIIIINIIFNRHFFANRWVPSSQHRPARELRARTAHRQGKEKETKSPGGGQRAGEGESHARGRPRPPPGAVRRL